MSGNIDGPIHNLLGEDVSDRESRCFECKKWFAVSDGYASHHLLFCSKQCSVAFDARLPKKTQVPKKLVKDVAEVAKQRIAVRRARARLRRRKGESS